MVNATSKRGFRLTVLVALLSAFVVVLAVFVLPALSRTLAGQVGPMARTAVEMRDAQTSTDGTSSDGRYHECGLITESGVTDHLSEYIARCGTQEDNSSRLNGKRIH